MSSSARTASWAVVLGGAVAAGYAIYRRLYFSYFNGVMSSGRAQWQLATPSKRYKRKEQPGLKARGVEEKLAGFFKKILPNSSEDERKVMMKSFLELVEKGELRFGDARSSFFKKIFESSNEDARRMVMKSLLESNSTVLSMN